MMKIHHWLLLVLVLFAMVAAYRGISGNIVKDVIKDANEDDWGSLQECCQVADENRTCAAVGGHDCSYCYNYCENSE
ncbi:MAG: hypothetical protein ABIF10_03300 [Candidatus Woesearchaeota archaeon]